MDKFVDKILIPGLTIVPTIRHFPDCNPAVAEGFIRFFEIVTLPHPTYNTYRVRHSSYSLTSRRYSIWSLLKDHLDEPLSSLINGFTAAADNPLFEGFKISSTGKYLPAWCIDNAAWASRAEMAYSPADWANITIPFPSHNSANQRLAASETDKIIFRIRAWESNLRFFIHCMESITLTSTPTRKIGEFLETIETVRSLLKIIEIYRPSRARDPLGLQDGVHPQLPDGKTRDQRGQFCELCWRLTMRSTAANQGSNSQIVKSRQLSDRFCEIHNPSNPKSRYRVDHRYKDRYILEKFSGEKSDFLKQLNLPQPVTGEEAQKDIYNRAHSRLRPLNKNNEISYWETLLDLHTNGMRPTDIARMLGKSPQSISRSLKRIRKIGTNFLERRDPRPKRMDYGPWSSETALVDRITLALEDGFSPEVMAKAFCAHLPTIYMVLQWIRENPLPGQQTKSSN